MKNYFLLVYSMYATLFISAKEPIVTAEKLLDHKRKFGYLGDFQVPEMVLVCYQQSTLQYLLKKYPEFQPSKALSHYYSVDNGRVGILGDWGVGAPGLAIKIEELISLGVKKFIAVGTAGELMNQHQIADFVVCFKALAEDGVAHLYLSKNQNFIEADQEMLFNWEYFTKERKLSQFYPATAWSFSAIFKETKEDVLRVSKLGCSVVEMEAATLYAIGKEKKVQTLSLFVISDSLTQEEWTPRIKDQAVRDNLHQLAEWALEFSMAQISSRELVLQ